MGADRADEVREALEWCEARRLEARGRERLWSTEKGATSAAMQVGAAAEAERFENVAALLRALSRGTPGGDAVRLAQWSDEEADFAEEQARSDTWAGSESAKRGALERARHHRRIAQLLRASVPSPPAGGEEAKRIVERHKDVRSRERRERIVASGWQIAETGGTAPPRDWGDALIPKEASRG